MECALADTEPAVIPLRRPTREVLALHNAWEEEWARYQSLQFGREVYVNRLTMATFIPWLLRISDAELSREYRKWVQSPEQYIEEQVRWAYEEVLEQAV